MGSGVLTPENFDQRLDTPEDIPDWSNGGEPVSFFSLPLFERGREIRPGGTKRGNDAFFEKAENARLLEQERLLEQTAEGGGYSSAYAGPITSRNQRPDNSDRPRVSNNQPNGQDVNELLQNADDQLMGSGVLTPENFDQRLDTPEQVDPFGDIDGEQVLAEFKADVAKENTPMVQRDTGYFTPDENGNLPFWSTKDGKAVDFFDLPLFERGREIRPTGRKKRGNDAFFEKDENARLLEQERLLEQTAEGGGYSSANAGPITSRNPIPEQVDPFGDIDGEQVLAEFKADVAQRGSNDVGVEDMVDFVGGFEGFKTDAYLDTKGNSTIGYGTTRYPDGTPVEMGDTITKEKALEFKTQHLEQSIKDAKDLVGNYDELPRDAKKILIDMIYNMGKDGVRDFRGFREALEEGDFEKASNHLMYQTGSPNGPITPYAIDTGDRAKAHIDTLKQLDQR